MLKSNAKSWKCLALITLAAMAVVGCGSSSTSTGNDAAAATGGSGVDGTKHVGALTTDEKKKVCDFVAQHYGGYGKEIDCGGGNTLSGDDATQADCLAGWPSTSCAATVSQLEKCTTDQVCGGPLIPDSCAPFLQCTQP